jgi:N-acetylmuramoyl-L-alanine amidase
MIQLGPRAPGVYCTLLILAHQTCVSAVPVAKDATAATPAEQTAPLPSCLPRFFKIALDVGHYRASPGAIGATGTTEFEYNLSLAHSVLASLRQAGFIQTFLIGESGAPLSLDNRTKIARDSGALLFVSLHHDSVQPRYLSTWTVKGRVQRYSDAFRGYSLFVSGRNMREQESKRFSILVAEALLSQGLTPSLHHAEKIPGENRQLLDARLGIYRSDMLEVLKTASMPAVLLESGIIVNRVEEQEIRRGPYHKKVVTALVKAIQDFCNRHLLRH